MRTGWAPFCEHTPTPSRVCARLYPLAAVPPARRSAGRAVPRLTVARNMSPKRVYAGPRLPTVGHRRYDILLKEVIAAVRSSTSREDLLTLTLDGLRQITIANAIVVLEIRHGTGSASATVFGYDQRGIHPQRWTTFCDSVVRTIPPGTLIQDVIEDDLAIDGWGTYYFGDELDLFSPLFDVKEGGWLLGIRLPRPSAQHPNRGLFLWYTTGLRSERCPPGAEQDWRFLTLFQYCYDMASFSLRKAARTIIAHRQELIRTLAPSILNHEIHARVGYFLSGLSFLRDSLAAVVQSAALPPGSTLTGPCTELTDAIASLDNTIVHARELSAIAHSVLGLTRRIATGPCHPIDEITSALRLLSHSAGKAGITLVAPASVPDPIVVHTDPALLMHVIVNLVNNSIDALKLVHLSSYSQERRVAVSIGHDAQQELPVWIAVSDNGPGIAPEDAEKIYEPGITRKPGGHGLGLHICRIVVQYLGGTLTLTHLRDPTTFRICLPATSVHHTDLEQELRSEIEAP